MALPQHLLDQALLLARLEQNRPRQASLRRAVSTTYYSLFHLLTSAAVANWKQVRQRPLLARAFEHRRMSDACNKARSRQVEAPSNMTARHLRTVANAF